jgi:uncharacterized protein DUF4145
MLYMCGGCGHGSLIKLHQNAVGVVLEEFYPAAVETASLPNGVPEGIVKELREAELCAAHGAYRGATALLRSTLEKTLKLNGYTRGNLQNKIDEAASDGIVTGAHQNKAHNDIRVLGNEVVHDDWRTVIADEFEVAHRYAQRILEDFYDVRTEVEKILVAKNRIAPPPTPTAAP